MKHSNNGVPCSAYRIGLRRTACAKQLQLGRSLPSNSECHPSPCRCGPLRPSLTGQYRSRLTVRGKCKVGRRPAARGHLPRSTKRHATTRSKSRTVSSRVLFTTSSARLRCGSFGRATYHEPRPQQPLNYEYPVSRPEPPLCERRPSRSRTERVRFLSLGRRKQLVAELPMRINLQRMGFLGPARFTHCRNLCYYFSPMHISCERNKEFQRLRSEPRAVTKCYYVTITALESINNFDLQFPRATRRCISLCKYAYAVNESNYCFTAVNFRNPYRTNRNGTASLFRVLERTNENLLL